MTKNRDIAYFITIIPWRTETNCTRELLNQALYLSWEHYILFFWQDKGILSARWRILLLRLFILSFFSLSCPFFLLFYFEPFFFLPPPPPPLSTSSRGFIDDNRSIKYQQVPFLIHSSQRLIGDKLLSLIGETPRRRRERNSWTSAWFWMNISE